MTGPILIGCAHGTREAAGQQVVRELLDMTREALGVEVLEAYVDVQEPSVADVVDSLPTGQGTTAVVVPLLLAGGYHVYVDIARAVAQRADVRAAAALGPDRRLVDVLLDHVSDAGIPPTTTLVLAAAGSSDARSRADTDAAAEMLRARWSGPVRVGYAAGVEPSVAEAVVAGREFGDDEEVAVASFLLVPGYFQSTLEKAGAAYVSAPLGADPRIVDIIVQRYRDALSA